MKKALRMLLIVCCAIAFGTVASLLVAKSLLSISSDDVVNSDIAIETVTSIETIVTELTTEKVTETEFTEIETTTAEETTISETETVEETTETESESETVATTAIETTVQVTSNSLFDEVFVGAKLGSLYSDELARIKKLGYSKLTEYDCYFEVEDNEGNWCAIQSYDGLTVTTKDYGDSDVIKSVTDNNGELSTFDSSTGKTKFVSSYSDLKKFMFE